MRILIVGAGCTGSAAAARLREKLGESAKIHVWEKARGAGGRYTTSRATYPDGLKADMGAQYASVHPEDQGSLDLMNAIVKADGAALVPENLLADIEERPRGTLQYRGTNGQNGIVKCMLDMSKAEVQFEKRVMKIDQRGKSWTVTPRDGAPQEFDCVLLCVPGCGPGGDNLNKIHGNWERLLTDAQWGYAEVPHDCRYSVALWLEPGHRKALEAFFGEALEKRVSGGVELFAWQSRKDGEDPDGPQAVVVHTPAGARGNKHQAEPRMIKDACRMLKLPESAVKSTKLITWFQSQVLSNTSKEPCIVANQQPPLILAGDYLTASTFTGCVKSATSAADMASKLLAGGVPSTGGYPAQNAQSPKGKSKDNTQAITAAATTEVQKQVSTLSNEEKQFLKVVKAFRDILKLEERQSSGEKLDKPQLTKLERKPQLLEELRQAEKPLTPTSDVCAKNADVLEMLQ